MDRAPYASELLACAGQALYGKGWQSALARDLGLQLRTVQRIAQAAREGRAHRVGEATMDRLADTVRARERTLKAAWTDIKRGYPA